MAAFGAGVKATSETQRVVVMVTIMGTTVRWV